MYRLFKVGEMSWLVSAQTKNARAGVMLADMSQLIFIALKKKLARLYGKRNARAGLMLADMSQLIFHALKTQTLLDFMVKEMPGQV